MHTENSGRVNEAERSERTFWNDDVRARLKQLVLARGSQAQIAKQAGMSASNLSHLVTGKGEPSVSKLAGLCEVLGVSVDFVLRGHQPDSAQAEANNSAEIPIHDVSFSAGGGTDVILSGASEQTVSFPKSWLREQFGSIGKLRMVRVSGDSMEPTIAHGSWVIIDLDRTSGPGMFAMRLYDNVYIKRLHFQANRIIAASDNPSHEVFVINLKDKADRDAFQVIGRVVWAGKML